MVPFPVQGALPPARRMRANHEINVLEGIMVKTVDPSTSMDRRSVPAGIHRPRYRPRPRLVQGRPFRNVPPGDKEPATFQEFWTFQHRASGGSFSEIEQTRSPTG